MTDWIGVPDNYDDYQGFVYIITCLKNGKRYIGQKSFWRIDRRKPLKNALSKVVIDKIKNLKDQYVDGKIRTKAELRNKITELKRKEKFRRSKLFGRKRLVRKETDWKKYFGSSKELLLDLEEFGESAFKREIIWLCTGKWWLTFLELKEQMDSNAIFRDDFYNGIINIRLANVVDAKDFDRQTKVFSPSYN